MFTTLDLEKKPVQILVTESSYDRYYSLFDTECSVLLLKTHGFRLMFELNHNLPN